MSKKSTGKTLENPYREGSDYHKLFAQLRRHPTTREKLVEFARKKMRKRKSAAEASVAVVLSPRKSSKRGDPRGNLSAAGHVYFVEKTENKKGETVYSAKARSRKLKPRRKVAA